MTANVESSSRPAEPWVAALAAVAVFALAWSLLHVGFWEREQIVDIAVYERYGEAVVRGEVPYRDFTPEYPPLALPVFALPALGDGDYRSAFEALMLACGAAMVALVAASGATPARLALAAVFPLLLGSVVLTRYDLFPAALTAGAVAALLAGRARLAGGVLGVAVAAKAYPAVLVPVAAVWLWRRRGRRQAALAGAAFLGALALAFVPFLLVAPDGVLSSLERQLSRPLQIESLWASALIVLHNTVGLDVEMVGSHGSQNVGGLLGDAVGVAASLVTLAALVWIWIRFARGSMESERLVRYSALALVALVALGKVLSPQFLIWLVPIVVLVRGWRAPALLAVALVLTQLWFPYRYWDYAREFDASVAWLVLARDLVLVGVLFTLARGSPRSA